MIQLNQNQLNRIQSAAARLREQPGADAAHLLDLYSDLYAYYDQQLKKAQADYDDLLRQTKEPLEVEEL